MKTRILCNLALLAHLCSCSTPAPVLQRPANLGRVGLVCKPGADKLKVERPGSPGELFSQGTISHAQCAVGVGASFLMHGAEAGPFIGFPLMATAAAAPLTGMVNATRGVSVETGIQRQTELRTTLSAGRWNALVAEKLKSAAARRGHAVVFARSADASNESPSLDACVGAVRAAGGDTLAEVEVHGPSLVVVDGWAQPIQIMVALRVRFYDAATGKSRRAVWVQVQEGPKRSQKEWQQDPAGLAAEVSRAIDKAAVKLAEKLSFEGGAGEVIASRF